MSHVLAVAACTANGYFPLFTHTSFCESRGTYRKKKNYEYVDRVLCDPWGAAARDPPAGFRESKWDSSAHRLAAFWSSTSVRPDIFLLAIYIAYNIYSCYITTVISTVNKCTSHISSLYLHTARLGKKILCYDDPKM